MAAAQRAGRRRTSECASSGRTTVRQPVLRGISKRLYRHTSQEVCRWKLKFSQELAEDSPFGAREFISGKDAVTLAHDIQALDQDAFSAAFRKSPTKRTKLVGLKRNAMVVLEDAAPRPQRVGRRAEPRTPSLVTTHAPRRRLYHDPEQVAQLLRASARAWRFSLLTALTTGFHFTTQPLACASWQTVPPLVGDRTVQGPEEVRAHPAGTLEGDASECFDGTGGAQFVWAPGSCIDELPRGDGTAIPQSCERSDRHLFGVHRARG